MAGIRKWVGREVGGRHPGWPRKEVLVGRGPQVRVCGWAGSPRGPHAHQAGDGLENIAAKHALGQLGRARCPGSLATDPIEALPEHSTGSIHPPPRGIGRNV